MISISSISGAAKINYTNIEKWTIASLILLSFTGISLINIGKAMLTPFHMIMAIQMVYALMVTKLRRKKISITLVLFMSYVVLINILQYPNFRITSVIYTLIYCIEIMLLINLITQCRIETILIAFRLIIYLFFFNILIAFCLDIIHFKHDLIARFFRIYYSPDEIYGRPMGFSSEPSYAAFILAVVLVAYSHITNHQINRTIITLFVVAILSILLSKSAYGFLFLMIVILDWLIYFYSQGDKLLKNLFPAILILFISTGFILVKNSENEALTRLSSFTSCLFDNSISGKKKLIKLQEADGSAFARIAPTYLLFNSSEGNNFNYLFGEGAGAAGKFLSKFLVGILIDEGRTSVDTGIMPALVFDYGYSGSLLFLIFLIFTFRGLPLPFWILFILIIPNANINTQLIWFAIACYSIVSKIKTQQKIQLSIINQL